MNTENHILYSFRRCPYAMRARLTLYKSGIKTELREVKLANKPKELLETSPKGTVPVLKLNDGKVIEESREIMHWALNQNDPDGWLTPAPDEQSALIDRNDGPFKKALDRYKYPGRFPDEDCSGAYDAGLDVLKDLNQRIEKNEGNLMRKETSLADIAIFPFIRQFAHVDFDRFMALPLTPLQNWLESYKKSQLFKAVMPKFTPWAPGDDPVLFGPENA